VSINTYRNLGSSSTPQSQPLLNEKQIANNAGGFVYELNMWKTFERFLILGTEGGTYYVSEKKLTREAATNAIACIEADGVRAVDTIVRISDEGRAPKNDSAILALALAASAGGRTPTKEQVATRQYALAALPKVCRIPTHLFHFNEFVEQFRGRSTGLNRAIGDWYQGKPIDELAYSLIKYQQRDGWSHRDLLRLVHPKAKLHAEQALYRYVTKGMDTLDGETKGHLPGIVFAFEEAKVASKADVISLIIKHNLSREMIPTEHLKDPKVQEALLEKMPPHALLRNLGNLSKSGLLKPLSAASKTVIDKLSQYDSLRRRRVHPMDVLTAMKVYGQGHGVKGDGSWTPVQSVVDALDTLLYESFGFVEPTGKRLLFGLDVSGSMTWGGALLKPYEIAALMALVCAKSEKEYFIHGFSTTFVDLGISPKMRMDDVLKKTGNMAFGSTDCALPMIYAKQQKLTVDAFIVITDNETWAGHKHPSVALREYRAQSGINAKQVVIGVTATNFTIADPKDPLTLDVVGCDTTTPAAVSEFIRS
jgi:60 kDa SS-A/Ro ribonucleoprotein